MKKWLIPEKLKSQFQQGFVTNWVELFENSRLTRSTPHKKRPETPIDLIGEQEKQPILGLSPISYLTYSHLNQPKMNF